MEYSLRDRFFFGLSALRDVEQRRLVGAMEAIAAQPIASAQAAVPDGKGRTLLVREVGRFRLYYHVGSDGYVTFAELLADPELEE